MRGVLGSIVGGLLLAACYPIYAPPPPYYYPYPPRYAVPVHPPQPPRVEATGQRRAEEKVAVAPSAATARIAPISISATELFGFDQDQLREPQPRLDEIAKVLKDNPKIAGVTITGYADRLGGHDYNLALSERRAESVRFYLMRKGVEGSRLNIHGKGEADPVVHCDVKEHAELVKCLEPNRRVVISTSG
jgi:OOP family OmpA-OmpF porin